MMLHSSIASTNESFSQWSTHGTALHLIISDEEQKILDQISGWKVPFGKKVPNIPLSRASQNLAPVSSNASSPVKLCSVIEAGNSTPKKVEESIQKSGRNVSKSVHKTLPSILTVNKKSHNRRYSLGDTELFKNNVFVLPNLKRSHSWPELYTNSKDSKPSLSKLVSSSKISSKVEQSIANENNRLKILSSVNQVDDQSPPLNGEEINFLGANVSDNTRKSLRSKTKHQSISKSNNADVQKSPYKSPKKHVNATTKKSKINVKKRILSPIKDVEENETSNIVGNADDTSQVGRPSKKRKTAKLIEKIPSNKSSEFGNKVTKGKNKSVSANNNQASSTNDLKYGSDNEDEIQSHMKGSVESLSKEPFSPFKHSTPMIFDIPNNVEQHINKEVTSNEILPCEHASQKMQDNVQNAPNFSHQVASPGEANCIYSQPEIFKDSDDTPNSDLNDTVNSSQSIIPNSDSIPNSNLDINSSMLFLSKGGAEVPRSQIPPEIIHTQSQPRITASQIPPEMVLSNISWGNSSLQIQPELIPSQIQPKIVDAQIPLKTVTSHIQTEAMPTLSPHKKSSSPLLTSKMLSVPPKRLFANSAAGNIVSSPLKNMPSLVLSGFNDRVKNLEPNKQCSTPVGDNLLPMKMSQDLFPIHAEDFMNISTSSGSIPCGQKQKSFNYMSSQPCSQDSISEKIVSATPSALQVGSVASPQTDKNVTYTVSRGNSARKLTCPKITSKSPAAQLINCTSQQIADAGFPAKALAVRKKLAFQGREKQAQVKEPQVPTKDATNKRKRKLSKDLKGHSHKKAKFVSVVFGGNDIKSILDNMQDIY